MCAAKLVQNTGTMNDWYQQDQFKPFSLTHDDSDGERPGAMLVHGFTGTPAEMRPLAHALFDLGCDAQAMLVRGMGPEIGSLNSMTARIWRESSLETWRDHVARYRRSILVGYSFGGALALIQAAEHPPDLLILLAPHVRLADRRGPFLPVVKYVIRELHQFKDTDFSDAGTRLWWSRAMPGLDLDDPRVQESIRTATPMSMAMLDEMRRLSREGKRVARLVPSPTVIIQGTMDTISLPRHSARLAKNLPNLVAYHEIPADHMLPFESFPSWPSVRELIQQAVTSAFPELMAGANA